MNLKIGEKIKELREKKNITQNKMAEYLGITEQAISRWENGGGYPDMELIPAISNFLNVSTDELFETDKKAERRNSLLKETYKYNGWDHRTNCTLIEMYRDILREFPNDFDTMSSLIVRLSHENYDPPGIKSEEIIALCNRIINDSPDLDLRRMTTCSLARAYQQIGEQEKAVKIIKGSPIVHSLQDGIGFSREMTLAYGIAEGEEMWENRKDVMQHLCNELCVSIRHFHLDENSNNIIVREKLIKILEIFYEDGDYGAIQECMLYTYIELAGYYLNISENDAALDNIEKCAETAIRLDTEKHGYHSSVLVKNLKIYCDPEEYVLNHGSHPENIRYNQSYHLIHDYFLSDEVYAPIRDVERFIAVIANLEKYAKVEWSKL